MAKDVKCKVDSCVHYKEGKCDANCILVGNCDCHCAHDVKETACDTFELK